MKKGYLLFELTGIVWEIRKGFDINFNSTSSFFKESSEREDWHKIKEIEGILNLFSFENQID